jgi:hypothetical protein
MALLAADDRQETSWRMTSAAPEVPSLLIGPDFLVVAVEGVRSVNLTAIVSCTLREGRQPNRITLSRILLVSQLLAAAREQEMVPEEDSKSAPNTLNLNNYNHELFADTRKRTLTYFGLSGSSPEKGQVDYHQRCPGDSGVGARRLRLGFASAQACSHSTPTIRSSIKRPCRIARLN